MNTLELAEVMHMTPNFYGVVPCCQIEQFKKYNEVSLIVNTDPHDQPGEHWVGIYKEGDTMYFFDSFGREMQEFTEPFASIMKDFASGVQVVSNRMKYQNDLFDTCGHWTYYYILTKSCGVDFSNFSNDTMKNELELIRQLKVIKENMFKLLY